jgi:DNA-binding PadR family transcriptional regulator
LLRVEEGSLYPALHRLEQAGLLRSEWRVSETHRRARYYSLSARGGADSPNSERIGSG